MYVIDLLNKVFVFLITATYIDVKKLVYKTLNSIELIINYDRALNCQSEYIECIGKENHISKILFPGYHKYSDSILFIGNISGNMTPQQV